MSTDDHDFGGQLVEARKARKLSVQEAAHATRMSAAYIEALESGALARFPNAAYAKSFLLMYAKYLGVDVTGVAKSIDTTTQVGVSDFQYLHSRAQDDKEFQKAASDSRYDFVVSRRENRSWVPLLAAGAAAALAGGILMVWMNITRVADDGSAFQRSPEPASPPASAVQPIDPRAENSSALTAAPAAPAESPRTLPEKAQPAPPAEALAPRPNVVALPNGQAPAAAQPVVAEETPNIPRARPISPVAKLAANDGALLADIPVPANPANAAASPGSMVSVNKDDSDVVLLEPRRKTWVVIRPAPGGEPLFEDYLYPDTRPMRLPPGKYYIELKEADAVAIVRNGKRISYVAPGVLVQ